MHPTLKRNKITKPKKDPLQLERDRYANYTELGICQHCRIQPTIEGETSCYDCKELRSKLYFAPRTEENKVTAISPKERSEKVLSYLKENKILHRKIGKNLYSLTSGKTFLTATITYFKDSVTKGKTYRIRNELKRKCDFFIAYCPDNEKYYIIPVVGVSNSIYFTLAEIKQHEIGGTNAS